MKFKIVSTWILHVQVATMPYLFIGWQHRASRHAPKAGFQGSPYLKQICQGVNKYACFDIYRASATKSPLEHNSSL